LFIILNASDQQKVPRKTLMKRETTLALQYLILERQKNNMVKWYLLLSSLFCGVGGIKSVVIFSVAVAKIIKHIRHQNARRPENPNEEVEYIFEHAPSPPDSNGKPTKFLGMAMAPHTGW
jgi:hypothetical protein